MGSFAGSWNRRVCGFRRNCFAGRSRLRRPSDTGSRMAACTTFPLVGLTATRGRQGARATLGAFAAVEESPFTSAVSSGSPG